MTTPQLLRWGQSGRYAAWDDRQVITALAARSTGVVTPVTMTAGEGLRILIDPGWLALADCGDDTIAVLTSPITLEATARPGDGEDDRTDELWADITDPETAEFRLAVRLEGEGGPGVMLATIEVPADAALAEDMELIPRPQDYAGSVPGPPGPAGPQGPDGAPGEPGDPGGPPGPQGEQGPEGSPGETGPEGPVGGVGPEGPQGARGEQGEPGTPGATGPEGAVGPKGETGDSGQATLIVGSFGQLRVPSELPESGLIPAGWDGTGRPATAQQLQPGWSLIHERDGSLWTFLGEAWPGGWGSPGVVQGPAGPQGERGEQGPPGPPGPGGAGMLRVFSSQQGFRIITTGNQDATVGYNIPGSELVPGRWFVVETAAVCIHRGATLSVSHRVNSGGGARYMEISGSISGTSAASDSHYFISYRAVCHIISGSRMINWTEGILGRGPNRMLHATWAAGTQAPGSQQELNNSQAPALVGNIGLTDLTPGADLTIALQANLGRVTDNPSFETWGSRCYWFMPDAAIYEMPAGEHYPG